MARKYGKKASEKIGRTLHEWKRGTLKSGSGGKVTSQKQAIAIGLSQARRAGYKIPPRGHAAMSLDARVRAYLGKMRPGQEIDARGIARAIGGVDPLEADYALERAQKVGLATTSDGRWFGPAAAGLAHSRKKAEAAWVKELTAGRKLVDRVNRDPKLRKRAAQLDRDIADALSGSRGGRRSHATKYDSDDARMFGRDAYRMERTKAQALSDARAEGFGQWQLAAVEDGWDAERRDTVHGGFAGTSHATRRVTNKSRELKELQRKRDDLLRALGYAGNTADQVRRYHDAIAEVDAQMKLLK